MELRWQDALFASCFFIWSRVIKTCDFEMRKTSRKQGVCRLTGDYGRFVKSHIIPAALTKSANKGAPLVQSGQGTRPVRRWTSWYDPRLVTDKGESILAKYDSWAISQLHQHKLVWDSWGPMLNLSVEKFRPIPDTPWGIRSISGIDPVKLRIFFLSLLWRAVETSLSEFKDIGLDNVDREQLREMVYKGNHEPCNFYPISLTQLSTRGYVHNLTPLAQTKTIPSGKGESPQTIPIFRFYFDGLIAHFDRSRATVEAVNELGDIIVGHGSELKLSTVTYENSFQRANLNNLMNEAYEAWPQELDGLIGPMPRL